MIKIKMSNTPYRVKVIRYYGSGFEGAVNDWLEHNPGIIIMDIKYQCTGDGNSNVCLILYKNKTTDE